MTDQEKQELIDKAKQFIEDNPEWVRQSLRDVYVCKYCGQAKIHYRLYGYRCRNPECQDYEARGE